MTRFPNSARSAWLQSRESKSSSRIRKPAKRLTLAERIEKRALDALMVDIAANLKRFNEAKDFVALECIRDYVADRIADEDRRKKQHELAVTATSARDEDIPF